MGFECSAYPKIVSEHAFALTRRGALNQLVVCVHTNGCEDLDEEFGEEARECAFDL